MKRENIIIGVGILLILRLLMLMVGIYYTKFSNHRVKNANKSDINQSSSLLSGSDDAVKSTEQVPFCDELIEQDGLTQCKMR